MMLRIGSVIFLTLLVIIDASCASRQDADVPEIENSDPTMSLLYGRVPVTHEVPAGWSVNRMRADRGRISLTSPDQSANIALFVLPASGLGTEGVIAALHANWRGMQESDPRIRISEIQRSTLGDGEAAWVFVARTSISATLTTIAHIVSRSNNPDFILVAVGAWPAEGDETAYSELFGRITGSVRIHQPASPPSSI